MKTDNELARKLTHCKSLNDMLAIVYAENRDYAERKVANPDLAKRHDKRPVFTVPDDKNGSIAQRNKCLRLLFHQLGCSLELLDHYIAKCDALVAEVKLSTKDLRAIVAVNESHVEQRDQGMTYITALELAAIEHGKELMRAKFFHAFKQLAKESDLAKKALQVMGFVGVKPIDCTIVAMETHQILGDGEFADICYFPIFQELTKKLEDAADITKSRTQTFKGLYIHYEDKKKRHPLDNVEDRKEMWFDAEVGPYIYRQLKNEMNFASVFIKKCTHAKSPSHT